MKTSTMKSNFYFPKHSTINTTPIAKTPHLLPINTTSYSKQPSYSFPTSSLTRTTTCSKQTTRYLTKTSHQNKPLTIEHVPSIEKPAKNEIVRVSSNRYSRVVVLGAVTVGFAMLFAWMDDQKALAFGPEGPLMEDFWDNMRRYGLYALTVSSGALYTIFLPIVELLKNPISAILLLVILGGSFYIVSNVLSAMIGVSEFAYEYGY